MTQGRILGIDPGLAVTGYGLIDTSGAKPAIVEAGIFRLNRSKSLPERLGTLHESLAELLDEQQPGVMVVEDLFSHYARPKTAILMGHARGVLLLAAAQRSIEVISYLPTRVKRALTGNGHASKEQMIQAIQLEFRQATAIKTPDVADALAVALCHHYTEGPTSASA